MLDAYNWMHLLLPYIEQKPLYDLYETAATSAGQSRKRPIGRGPRLRHECQLHPGPNHDPRVHQCPSDRVHIMNETHLPYYTRARGNYRGCAGSGDLYGNNPIGAPTGYVAGIGVFSVTRGQICGTANAPKQSTFADMIDGSSNCVMFAEALKPAMNNWSTIGDNTLGNMGGSLFSTFLTPNSSAFDRPWGPCPQPQGDSAYRWPCQTLGGPNRPPGNHNNNQRTAHVAARSLHPGGVNICPGGRLGAIRGSDDRRRHVARPLGTIQGAETLPNF